MIAPWTPSDGPYPILPRKGEELVDFMLRWQEEAGVSPEIGRIVFDLVLVLSSEVDFLDDELGQIGGAVIDSDKYTRLREHLQALRSHVKKETQAIADELRMVTFDDEQGLFRIQ